jgi:hypothetical protein
MTTALSTTATKWVSTCTSVNLATAAYTLDVNGVPASATLANMARPARARAAHRCACAGADLRNAGVAMALLCLRRRCLTR